MQVSGSRKERVCWKRKSVMRSPVSKFLFLTSRVKYKLMRSFTFLDLFLVFPEYYFKVPRGITVASDSSATILRLCRHEQEVNSVCLLPEKMLLIMFKSESIKIWILFVYKFNAFCLLNIHLRVSTKKIVLSRYVLEIMEVYTPYDSLLFCLLFSNFNAKVYNKQTALQCYHFILNTYEAYNLGLQKTFFMGFWTGLLRWNYVSWFETGFKTGKNWWKASIARSYIVFRFHRLLP